jgi:two-component system phosphate regulon sensor histidine kinase PhoR
MRMEFSCMALKKGCKYTAYFHGVNRRRTNLLIVAMALVLSGLVALQFSWVYSTVLMREQIFERRVASVLEGMNEVFVRANFTLHSNPADTTNRAISGGLSGGDDLMPTVGQSGEHELSREEKMLQIDSLLTRTFAAHGVESEYRTAVFDRYNRPVFVRESDESSIPYFLEEGFHSPLGNRSSIDNIQLLYVWFPNRTLDQLAGLWFQLALNIVLMGIMVMLTLYTTTGLRKAQRLNKLKADLINNMTHELKTPISTIGLAAEALSEPGVAENDEDRQYYLKMIRAENRRLTLLVENVLSAAVLDQGVLQLVIEPINVNDLLKEVVRKQAIAIHKRSGRVVQRLEAEQPLIAGDLTHWTNVVFNLVDNAMKYGGDAPILTLKTWNENEMLNVSFDDNGVGISKEHLSKIFDKLYRVPTGHLHDVKGFGIGLSYVKSVVEQHDARIEVRSEFGVGSTFLLQIPLMNLKPTH